MQHSPVEYCADRAQSAKSLRACLSRMHFELDPRHMTDTKTSSCILVVNDDVLLREMLCRALRMDGYDVLTATSGSRALAVLATTQPDAIVTSARGSVMNGATHYLHAYLSTPGPHAPIFLLTSEPIGRHSELREMVDATLSMPFDIDAFLALVADLAKPKRNQGPVA